MKKVYQLIPTLLSILFFISCNAGQKQQPVDADLSTYLNRVTDSLQRSKKLPGIIVGVIDHGKRYYSQSGFAQPENKLPFDSSTLFEIGSITKTFTAYTLSKILKENNIPDSTSIINYLPDSVKNNSSLQAITFLKLMNHSSGLPRLPDNMKESPDPLQPYEFYDINKLYQYLKNAKTTPGATVYSNLGAAVAGVLAEKISGKSYSQLLTENIYSAFGMEEAEKNTMADKNRSYGHFQGMRSEYWKMAVFTPAGGIKSSAKEMLNYLSYMMSPQDSLAKTIITSLQKPTGTIKAGWDIGKAWIISQNGDNTYYWHNGGTFGFSTFAAYSPTKQVAVVIAINEFNKNEACDGLGHRIMGNLLQ